MTANVFPFPSDLPSGSLPFAREAIKRIEELERLRASDQSSATATDKGLAASVKALSEQTDIIVSNASQLALQVADLAGRVSYQASNSDQNGWSGGQPANVSYGPTITFTVDRPRVISVQFFAKLTVFSSAGSGASNRSEIAIGARVDGNVLSASAGSEAVAIASSNGGGMGYDNIDTTNTARYITTVDAGTHTVQGVMLRRTISNSGTASGSIYIANPAVFVDVLQPV